VVYGFDRMSDTVKLIHASEKSMDGEIIEFLMKDSHSVLVYTVSDYQIPAELNKLRKLLDQNKCDAPVIFRMIVSEPSEEDFTIRAAVSLGGAFIDGFGDGIWLENELSFGNTISTSLGILQACRARMSKTEFIACPSCGRTNFNLMETLALIKKATGHLKGLKIGVMGCIVNGPGEMADADYGYVGSGKGKVTLYRGREIYKKGIPEDRAVEELVALIKENGDWLERV
jgi:(E)-4-hydroxy-3-methylbut-2-enyl-diphosphate synthase